MPLQKNVKTYSRPRQRNEFCFSERVPVAWQCLVTYYCNQSNVGCGWQHCGAVWMRFWLILTDRPTHNLSFLVCIWRNRRRPMTETPAEWPFNYTNHSVFLYRLTEIWNTCRDRPICSLQISSVQRHPGDAKCVTEIFGGGIRKLRDNV